MPLKESDKIVEGLTLIEDSTGKFVLVKAITKDGKVEFSIMGMEGPTIVQPDEYFRASHSYSQASATKASP